MHLCESSVVFEGEFAPGGHVDHQDGLSVGIFLQTDHLPLDVPDPELEEGLDFGILLECVVAGFPEKSFKHGSHSKYYLLELSTCQSCFTPFQNKADLQLDPSNSLEACLVTK